MTTRKIDFWLNESDLKTPVHDEMVIWCFENTEKILKELNIYPELESASFHGYKDYYSTDKGIWDWEIKQYVERNDEGLWRDEYKKQKNETESDYLSFQKLVPKIIFEKTIEYKIPNQYNLGFIDLRFKCKKDNIESRYFRYNHKNFYEEIYLEIKPEIKSIGETMRQINYYRNYLNPNSKFIIVTKSEGLKEIFASQGILVYEYNKENSFKLKEGDNVNTNNKS